MKIIFLLSLFSVILVYQLSAQTSFNAGLIASSGYSFNRIQPNKLFLLQPEINNTIPVEMGVFTNWKLTKRITVNLETKLDYNNYSIAYNDLKAFEENWPNSEIPVFANSFLLHENYSVFSIKFPINMHYYITKRFYFIGGTGMRFLLIDSLKNKSEYFYSLGIGVSGKKIGWQLSIEDPSQNRSYKLPENFSTMQYPNIGVECQSRSIIFSLTYSLWSKQ